jgi:hypothetical protein
MKFITLLLFFVLISCTNNKKVYMCGDRECVDKKEIKEHFKKELVVEIKPINKKENKKNDLILLNKKNKNVKSSNTSSKILEEKTNKEKKRLAKLEIKNKRKEEKLKKKQNKIISKNEDLIKSEKEEVKKIAKISDKKKLKKTKANTYKSKGSKNDICNILVSCDINEIEDYLTKKGVERDYPDISAD